MYLGAQMTKQPVLAIVSPLPSCHRRFRRGIDGINPRVTMLVI